MRKELRVDARSDRALGIEGVCQGEQLEGRSDTMYMTSTHCIASTLAILRISEVLLAFGLSAPDWQGSKR